MISPIKFTNLFEYLNICAHHFYNYGFFLPIKFQSVLWLTLDKSKHSIFWEYFYFQKYLSITQKNTKYINVPLSAQIWAVTVTENFNKHCFSVQQLVLQIRNFLTNLEISCGLHSLDWFVTQSLQPARVVKYFFLLLYIRKTTLYTQLFNTSE